jgi:Ca-activated chloride channel family protein
MQFPEKDRTNPEIERMWAWKRIDGLLKRADRSGSRTDVVDEVIRLGEGYSILTEYTSFLVLENDAEYKRWKIERRNARRLERDRRAQEARRDELEAIRTKAVADLGPQPVVRKDSVAQERKVQQVASRQIPQPPAQPTSNNSTQRQRQSWDFDIGSGGSGPVGPLFVAVAYWMRRRKSRSGKQSR